MKTKDYETVECECGNECPVEFSTIDENGCWTCANCTIDFIQDQANDATDNSDTCAIGDVVGRSEQLVCPRCKSNKIAPSEDHHSFTDCEHCGMTWAN